MGLGSFMPIHFCAIRRSDGERIARTKDQRVSYKTCDGIHAEDEDRHGPFPPPTLRFGHPVEQREEEEAEPAGEQDKRTGPQVLVDRKPAAPQLAAEHSQNSKEHHATDKLGATAL